ncbi:putative methyltransferase AN0656 [Hyphodiscus hymeniophilus]|uniref:Methyltransferase AN0656 n=1 Tax=Hyphodiscus hymeniophilus TaxID=353542 RepID=A0A9P6VMN0_9HELO|nr:putative methyltransferase AN0656 [Hyphodiscus hymeniophilus]
MSTSRPVQSVSNAELYNRWAKVYDTDGNILQALDDLLLPTLLTQLFTTIQTSNPNSTTNSPTLTITELGAGTGRNTVKLLSPALSPSISISHINALDLSPGMLEVARERCCKYLSAKTPSLAKDPEVAFFEFDALNPAKFLDVRTEVAGKADVVLSTLVLEHLPIDVFFKTVRGLLRETGWLVLTNMHAEMGRLSQAGFVDEETGEKIRGESYVYEVHEVLEEGNKWGFHLEGEVIERGWRKVMLGMEE